MVRVSEIFMTADELKKYKQQVMIEHRDEIAAIDRLIAREEAKPASPNGVAGVDYLPRPNEMLRKTVSGMGGEFTREDVTKRIIQLYGACPLERQQMTVELWKLSRAGVLKTVREGRGRTPAVYARK
jgi:hypothetical protein